MRSPLSRLVRVPLTSLRVKVVLLFVVPLVTVVTIAGAAVVGLGHSSQQSADMYQNALDMQAGADVVDATHDGYEVALLLIAAVDEAELRRHDSHLVNDLIPRFERVLSVERLDDAHEREQAARVAAGWQEFLRLWRNGDYHRAATTRELALANQNQARRTEAIFEPMNAAAKAWAASATDEAAASYRLVEQTRDRTQVAVLALILVALVGCLGAARALTRSLLGRIGAYSNFAVSVARGDQTGELTVHGADELTQLGGALNELVRRQRQQREYEATRNEFVDTLAHAENEHETHDLMKRQLERAVPGCTATVLRRNNSNSRLDAVTDLAADGALRARLDESSCPRSCLAIRLGRRQEQDGQRSTLTHCSICSTSDGSPSTCQPVTVSGEVIGSVLVQLAGPLTESDRTAVQDTVTRAAPVLANQRTLALAEHRANNDALTGLANRRALDDTLKRMVAQATRAGQPLAALLLDLDHFKQLNDRYGHSKGDEALAVTGAALRAALREGDFVARYGGEEFAVLLPATDGDGARHVAQTLLHAVRATTVPGVDSPITVSIGLAVLPVDAEDARSLLRLADRALYTAKLNGRNRVESAFVPNLVQEDARAGTSAPNCRVPAQPSPGVPGPALVPEGPLAE